MKRRLLAALMAGAMVVSMTGCGGTTEINTSNEVEKKKIPMNHQRQIRKKW